MENIKEVITSRKWQIRFKQGQNKKNVFVVAKRKEHIADKSDFFSQWCSFNYADRLYFETFDKHITQAW